MRELFIASGLVLLVLAGVGCGKPLPKDKLHYVGEWRGTGMTLTITADGGLDYRRVGGSGERSVTSPIQKFVGDDIKAGVGLLSTTFSVSSPPHQEGDAWKMTVDGVELTRVADGR